MRKDYKTIREVVGPLMTVDHVAGVKYDELVEIHQANGEVRSGRVLVIDGDRALVQLFESSQGLQASTAKARFVGHGISSVFLRICWAASSTVWATPLMVGPRSFPRNISISMGLR